MNYLSKVLTEFAKILRRWLDKPFIILEVQKTVMYKSSSNKISLFNIVYYKMLKPFYYHMTIANQINLFLFWQKLKHLTYINFSCCQFITHFPDVSDVPNLRKLKLDHCRSLIAIHPSVGFLKNLERLNARNCTKLKDFLPTMYLPSLQFLDLQGTSIEFFPHIEQEMCKPLEILLRCPLKELPDSISNLRGLEQLSIISSRLPPEGLPSDLFLLPKIAYLCIEGSLGSPKVGESFRRFLNSHVITTIGRSASNKPRYSPLRALKCDSCGLTDEDLHVILCCFPNLEELSVQLNELISFPVSIKESANLISLDVGYCTKLKEIPELPLSIQEVLANYCQLLSSEAYKMLWSQVRILFKYRINGIFFFPHTGFVFTTFAQIAM